MTAAQFLRTYEEEFIVVVNAKQTLVELTHEGVISEDVKATIESAEDEDANFELLEHLNATEKNATLKTLRAFCDVASAADRYPEMQELARRMMEALPPEGWLVLYVLVIEILW